jgi:hypothetical protein
MDLSNLGTIFSSGGRCTTTINGVTYTGNNSVIIKNGRVIIDGVEVKSEHSKPLPPAPILSLDANAATVIDHLEKYVGLHDRAKVLANHDNAFLDSKLAPSALKAIGLCALHDRADLIIQWLTYCPTIVKALRGWTTEQFAALLELCALHNRAEVFNDLVAVGIELGEEHVNLLFVHHQTKAALALLKLVKSKSK